MEWYAGLIRPANEPTKATLIADVLRRYHIEHGSKIRTKGHVITSENYWLDFWTTSTVDAIRDIKKQEEFIEWLKKKGLKNSAINRIVTVGKAALNRAYRRGEMQAPPYIIRLPEAKGEPLGRPMTVEELRKLYAAAAPHLQTFIRWMLGTGARPEAILQLQSKQVSWSARTIDLNGVGRVQNKKRRPLIKLPETLSGEVFEGHLITYKNKACKSLKTAWNAAVRRCGLDEACIPYSLRHTAAKFMRSQSVSMDEVGQILGHQDKSNAITTIYTADDPAYLRKATRALDKLVREVTGLK